MVGSRGRGEMWELEGVDSCPAVVYFDDGVRVGISGLSVQWTSIDVRHILCIIL